MRNMKRKIVSVVIAFFAMAVTCAGAFADTVTFDKKNKGNEKDFVTFDFSTSTELAALCKKYPKNNAEVLIQAGSPLGKIPISINDDAEFFSIIKCFPGAEFDMNLFTNSGVRLNADSDGTTFENDALIEFKYDGKAYSLSKVTGQEPSIVSFFKFNMKDRYYYYNFTNEFITDLLDGFGNAQKYEFRSVKEFEKLQKKHKDELFCVIIPANSKIRTEKELEKLSKLIFNDSKTIKKKYDSYFSSNSTVVIEPLNMVPLDESDSQSFIDKTISSLSSVSKDSRKFDVCSESDSTVIKFEKAILNLERERNKAAGLGNITNAEAEKERKQNEASGHGRITNAEYAKKLENERVANEKAGLGKITNEEVKNERKQNEAAGRGRLTNAEYAKKLENERIANEKAGLGKLTNEEVEKERKQNEAAGYGRLTNTEVKVITSLAEKGFVYVEGGTFMMGNKDGDDDEKSIHSVTLDSFYMCDHEVTQKEFRDVIGSIPCYSSGDNSPVEEVTWFDAIEYCNALSQKEGLTPCYTNRNFTWICDFSANGYRLPTEAEWEYAARGGKNSKGYMYSGTNDLNFVPWYEYGVIGIDDVGRISNTPKQRIPNELGIYDMSGSVWEWCWDWYGAYSKNEQKNPCGASQGTERVLRGGASDYCDSTACRVTNRSYYTPGDYNAEYSGYYYIGFRVVRSANVANFSGEKHNAANSKEQSRSDDWVFVCGGNFKMGNDDGKNDEKPVHEVRLNSFYMCNHEVTQKEYRDVMGNNPSCFIGDNKPVECVTWYDAIEYCNALSLKEGLTPCYNMLRGELYCNISANGYRLPTEAEWEYAARGGKKNNGYSYSGSSSIGNIACYDGNSGDATHDVKTKSPNELGIYDMSGNVFEWCWDWYDKYSSGYNINPIGNNKPGFRVLRGGAFHCDPFNCRVTGRQNLNPYMGDSYYDIGFRVVRSAK